MYNSHLLYDKPAERWVEALPLGNGHIGAMVYGGICEEKISLNHDSLWTGIPRRYNSTPLNDLVEVAKNLTFEGKYEEAHKLLTEKCLEGNSQVYLPLGDLDLVFDNVREDVTNYKRILDLENAVATVSFENNCVTYTREYFLSNPDNVMVIRISSDCAGKIGFKLQLTSQLKSELHSSDNNLLLYGECPHKAFEYTLLKHREKSDKVVEYWEEEENSGYEYFSEPEKRGICFGAGIKVINKGGELDYSDSCITLKSADEAIIIFSATTSYNGPCKHPFTEGKEYKNNLSRILDTAVKKEYEDILKMHISDYTDLFSRTRLFLGNSGRENWTTDKRLIEFKKDGNDISLYPLLFDFGRYLTISSSRKGSQATNLQGLWNNSLTPPWRCSYTLNINAEMNYWHTMMCGLEDCFEPLIKLVQNAVPNGRISARNIYNAPGFVMHVHTDIWGFTSPLSGNALYGFWNGASGWLCNSLYEYYEYTCDKQYLADICYPLMKEAAVFYLSLLTDRGDGNYSLCPATSPENYFKYPVNGEMKKAAVAKYTTMSDSIAYLLFKNCLSAIAELHLDNDNFVEKLKFAVSKMQPFAIGSDGRLLEWNEEFEEDEPTHRHSSHLYGLHPAHLITVKNTPSLADACRKTLEARGDGGSGWSIVWKSSFWARLRDGNHALKFINKLLNLVTIERISYVDDGGIYPNLFVACPPFQIDGNFGVVNSILELLVDSYDDEVEFLPALPDSWKNGSLTGVRVKGNKIYDIEWADGKLTCVKER